MLFCSVPKPILVVVRKKKSIEMNSQAALGWILE